MPRKLFIVSRCAWTLWNFRAPLLRAAAARDFSVKGAGADGDGFREKVEAAGFTFHPIPVDKRGLNPIADLKLCWALMRWYRRERPDVVHHFTIKPVIWGTIAAWAAGVPTRVATITGLGYAFTENRGTVRWIAESLYRFALSKATTIFFQNQDDLQTFIDRKIVNPVRCQVTPGSGVDLAHFGPAGGEFHRNEPLQFLMVARALGDKGLHEYAAAAQQMKAQSAAATFTFLGGIDERNPTAISAAQLRAWSAENRVTWVDAVDDVRPYIARADVVVLPSYREGLPRVLLEAAAMGKPLLTTDVPGCREIGRVGCNAFLVPEKDAPALARAMQAFVDLSAQELQKMGQASRAIVENEYSVAKVIDQTFAAYANGAVTTHKTIT